MFYHTIYGNLLESSISFCFLPLYSVSSHNLLSCSKKFYNVPSCSVMFRHVPQYFTIFRNVPQYSTMFRNVPQYSAMFHNILQCSTMFCNVPSGSVTFYPVLLVFMCFLLPGALPTLVVSPILAPVGWYVGV